MTTKELLFQSIMEDGPLNQQTLLEKIKKNVISYYRKNYNEEITFEPNSKGFHDLRVCYAKAVANINKLEGWRKNLFVILKTENFGRIDIVEFREFCSSIESELGLTDRELSGGHWHINDWVLKQLLMKGLSYDYVVRLAKMIEKCHDTVHMGNFYENYRRGVHIGSYASDVTRSISRDHVKYFNTYLRVFKYSRRISPVITARYLRVLQNYSDDVLYYTINDSRNWIIDQNKKVFRLVKIVKNNSEWSPLRVNHIKDQKFLRSIGRIPKDYEIKREFPNELLDNIDRKIFGKAIKSLTHVNAHGLIAACRLQMNNLMDKLPKQSDMIIHDYGIELPNYKLSSDQLKFLKRYFHNYSEATLVVKNWNLVLSEGINPLEKEGLKTSLDIIRSMNYENIENKELASECSHWGLTQEKFETVQRKFQKSIKELTYQSIPKIDFLDGDYRCYVLSKEDPRGIFLGHYTGCCQHPLGQGAACAEYGQNSPDSGFFVIEKNGKILAQSWIWVNDDYLIFDNIEGGYGDKAKLAELYRIASKKFKNSWRRIKNCFVGISGTDIEIESPTYNRPVNLPSDYHGYNDSHKVVEI